MAQINMRVNGQARTVDVDESTPLLYVLSDELALNGPKFGCGLGQCGACTVIVKGQATRSCVTPVKTVANGDITTLEGLGTPDKPHPIQQAFIDEQAAQCGFCLNGVILTAKAFLDKNPRASEQQIQQTATALIQEAAKPLQDPKLRELLIEIKKKNELTIDHVSQDQVIEAGFSADALARARTIVQSFEQFITQHKDGITALQVLYSKPYKQRLKFDIVNIPYVNAGQGTNTVVSGELPINVTNAPFVVGLVKGGRLRALAVASAKRQALLPDVPTMQESGVPDFEVNSWYGVCAPAAVPTALLDKLNADIVSVLRMPDIEQRLSELGMPPAPTTRDEFDQFMRAEIARWAQVIKAAGIPKQ